MLRTLGLAALGLAAAGCRPDDQVRTYTVPKETSPAAAPAAVAKVEPPAAGSPVRTLAVIVPVGGDRSRFVKLLGPADAVGAVADQFQAFARSLKVATGPNKELEYTLPAGWREAPKRQMRQATFQAGEPGKVVDVYISDPFGGDVLGNVNRWRKEVSLPDIGTAELPAAVQELKLATGPATLVDLRGTATAGGMMRGPFQK